LICEAQLTISKDIKNTGIVVTTDAGDCNDIHPSKREIIAKRLSNMARAKQYGFKNLNYKSGECKSMSVKNNQVTLNFKFQKNDFFIQREDINGFAIAGWNKIFYKAEVSFSDNKKRIILYSPNVKTPIAVRYGFKDCFESNLRTNSTLPISVFRTDNW